MFARISSILAMPKPPTGGTGLFNTLYVGAVNTVTTNQTSTTWSSIDLLGPEHPKRIVVVGVWHGINASATPAALDGIPYFFREQNTAHEFSMFAFQVPCGTGAIHTLNIQAVGSLTKANQFYTFYPACHAPLDSGTATANTTANAVVSNIKFMSGGVAFYCGGQNATLGAFGTTWNGTADIIEDTDAQLEAGSYTFGRIGCVTTQASSDLSDVTLAETVSGTKRLVVASWGPPYRYAA